jgi:hypothetical protein
VGDGFFGRVPRPIAHGVGSYKESTRGTFKASCGFCPRAAHLKRWIPGQARDDISEGPE